MQKCKQPAKMADTRNNLHAKPRNELPLFKKYSKYIQKRKQGFNIAAAVNVASSYPLFHSASAIDRLFIHFLISSTAGRKVFVDFISLIDSFQVKS
jgi:hypothetical protein